VILYLDRAEIADLQQVFIDVLQVAVSQCEYCMPFENDLPIFLGRGIRVPIEQAWAQTKYFQ
jgi:arylamine N-acetyltransferase